MRLVKISLRYTVHGTQYKESCVVYRQPYAVYRNPLISCYRSGRFNSFQFNDEVDLEKALVLHRPLSIAYQGDVTDPRPIFLRR